MITNNELVKLANEAIRLLAAGLVDQIRLIKEEKKPFVHDDNFLSGHLKMAMFRLASLYLLSGRENTVCGAHNLVERCKKPFSEKHWGLPVFDMSGFQYNRLALLFDDDTSLDDILKPECVDIASGLTAYADHVEKEIFRELREICERFGCEDDRHKVYSALREFVVRHPVTTREEYGQFMDSKGVGSAKGLAESILSTCYLPAQPHHLVNGVLLQCGNCGAPLKSYQNTDEVCCRIEECKHFGERIPISSALTRPAIDPKFGTNDRFSLVCRISLETLPGELRRLVIFTFSRRRWARKLVDSYPTTPTIGLRFWLLKMILKRHSMQVFQ